MKSAIGNQSSAMDQLAALARQIRAEVDAGRKVELEDGFKNSTYRGAREYRRSQVVVRRVSETRRLADQKKRLRTLRRRCLSFALPGEVLMGDWIKRQARREKRDRSTISNWLREGRYPGLQIRRVNPRLVFVRDITGKGGV